MINPIDRATKKITIHQPDMYRGMDELPYNTMYGTSVHRLPVVPNKRQLRERIKQHMKKEPSFMMMVP